MTPRRSELTRSEEDLLRESRRLCQANTHVIRSEQEVRGGVRRRFY